MLDVDDVMTRVGDPGADLVLRVGFPALADCAAEALAGRMALITGPPAAGGWDRDMLLCW